MITLINDFNRVVSIPSWVVDLESFRRWADADDFPEDGRAWYLKGEVPSADIFRPEDCSGPNRPLY